MFELLSTKVLVHADKFLALSILIFLGLVIRLALQFFGQTWIQTKAHTTTILLLPIITYVITNVISGNIALSLGMVGALSIVRFRNPVRSPLELSVYFGAITMGIAAGVSLQWLVFLVAAIVAAILALSLTNMVSNKMFAVPFFNTSFSEGNSLSSLSVTTQQYIPGLDDHQLLQSKVVTNTEGPIVYYLSSNNFELLRTIQKEIHKNNEAQSTELRR